MSIVKYTNKKTGVVTLYESTSHYDPKTKQSRPVRKYLGREDPVTGELIPSSGRRGRKKDNPTPSGETPAVHQDSSAISALRSHFENEMASRNAKIKEQAVMIRRLEAEKASVIKKLSALIDELTD